MVGGSPLDVKITDKSRLSKPCREDSQLYSFLLALTVRAPVDSPFTVGPGEDPPDRRVVGASGRSWAIELAELTLPETRTDLARMRAFGRRLQTFLNGRSDAYPHLVGNRVMLTLSGDDVLPRDDQTVFNDVAEVLTEDRGCWLDGIDLMNGLPDNLGRAGVYLEAGSMAITVERGGIVGQIQVVATTSRAIYPHEAVNAFCALVRAKDRPENEVLLITCGAPDEHGYICGFDLMLMRMLEDAAQQGQLLDQDPAHLKAVALHYWGLTTFLSIDFDDGYVAPWTG